MRRPGPRARRRIAAFLAAMAVAVPSGCARPRAPAALPPPPPLRLSAVADEGDAARRASQRLLLEGLDDELRAQPDHALAQYERALQVDATNPWAWLALARHELLAGRPARALSYLDKTEALLAPDDVHAGRASAHLLGLRGQALRDLGREEEGLALLRRARAAAPAVWADGRLDAGELR